MEHQEKRSIITTAPIPMDLLRLKFTEDVHYIIDYTQSKFKGKVLLTYLTNLNLDCEIKFSDTESEMSVFKEYLSLTSMVQAPQFENIVIHILLDVLGVPNGLTFDPTEFIQENSDILARWLTNVAMLPTYSFHCHPKLKEHVNNYEEVEDDLRGINFVNLIKHPDFPLLISAVPDSTWCWNKTFFNEPCFAGKDMFQFFMDKNNPLFISLLTMEGGPEAVKFIEVMSATANDIAEFSKGVEHVSLD